jgi:hypothetical protein
MKTGKQATFHLSSNGPWSREWGPLHEPAAVSPRLTIAQSISHRAIHFGYCLHRDETGATLIEVHPYNVRGETLTLRSVTIPASPPTKTRDLYI